MNEAKKRVIAALYAHQPASAYAINDACGYSDRRMAGKILAGLFRRNLATVDDDGRWLLTSKGMRAAGVSMPTTTRRRRRDEDDYGVTVTMREQVTGELDTITRPGKAEQALRDVCAVIDGAAGDWRIVTISTPNTILRDLTGDRENDTLPPERMLLKKIGREDVLEPAGVVWAAA